MLRLYWTTAGSAGDPARCARAAATAPVSNGSHVTSLTSLERYAARLLDTAQTALMLVFLSSLGMHDHCNECRSLTSKT